MGNLAAGKSTVGSSVDNWQQIVIDNFRSKNHTEHQARQLLLDAVNRANGNIIYETTTANLIHPKVMKAIQNRFSEIIKVKLHISQAESQRRCEARPYQTWLISHENSFQTIQQYLNREWSDLFFNTETTTPEEIKTGIITYVNTNFPN